MESLKVHNSLRPGPPVPFEPIQPGKVSWYACGPTVYDHAHLGHARNYVSTDIIRRILKDYFKFNVNFVMNITDIDDKIILKARRKRLLELEKAKTYTNEDLVELATKAFDQYVQNNLAELATSGDKVTPPNYIERRDVVYKNVLAGKALSGQGKPGDAEAKIKMHIANADSAAKAIMEQKVWGAADEIMLPYLDSQYKETVDARDHQIFTDVTKFWEADFMEDMESLNVLKPDVVTRVTEYVPQIVDFVNRIVEKGFAYEADGSIYFDITAFEKAGNTYAHLRPDSRSDQALLADGEGSLSKGATGKRGAGDFALWKRSKAGEPSWPSPWGDGRPGWHIECSVMASDVLGSRMDIHSGGIDLAFPHHDNELAQSEAFYCENGCPHTWVNYFLHMGHLSIAGSKMSKSLKNFQTIKDALASGYTARGMRIVFLMGRWNDGVEISPDMRVQADTWESSVNNLFINVKSLLHEANASSSPELQDLSISKSSEIDTALEKAQAELQSALVDSFNTPKAMQVIYDLVKDANIYLSTHNEAADIQGLEKVARWVTKIVGIFGLDANAQAPYDGLGWAVASTGHALDPTEVVKPYAAVYDNVVRDVHGLEIHSEALDKLIADDVAAEFASVVSTGTSTPETVALPYLRAVSRIRDELRKIAPSSPLKKAILTLSDRIRDEDLLNLGVYLDDRTDGRPSLIKFVPKEELIAQREEKAAKEREKAAQKEAARLAREKLEKEKAEKAKLSPQDMYKSDERFSAWDDDGMPTKMKNGDDVAKSMLKKLKKDWDRQKKLHEEFKKA